MPRNLTADSVLAYLDASLMGTRPNPIVGRVTSFVRSGEDFEWRNNLWVPRIRNEPCYEYDRALRIPTATQNEVEEPFNFADASWDNTDLTRSGAPSLIRGETASLFVDEGGDPEANVAAILVAETSGELEAVRVTLERAGNKPTTDIVIAHGADETVYRLAWADGSVEIVSDAAGHIRARAERVPTKGPSGGVAYELELVVLDADAPRERQIRIHPFAGTGGLGAVILHDVAWVEGEEVPGPLRSGPRAATNYVLDLPEPTNRRHCYEWCSRGVLGDRQHFTAAWADKLMHFIERASALAVVIEDGEDDPVIVQVPMAPISSRTNVQAVWTPYYDAEDGWRIHLYVTHPNMGAAEAISA